MSIKYFGQDKQYKEIWSGIADLHDGRREWPGPVKIDQSGTNSLVNVHPVLQKHRRQGMFTIQKHLNKASWCSRTICDDDQIHNSQLETSIIKSYTASVLQCSNSRQNWRVYMAFHQLRIICSVYQQVSLQLSEINILGICKNNFLYRFPSVKNNLQCILTKKKILQRNEINNLRNIQTSFPDENRRQVKKILARIHRSTGVGGSRRCGGGACVRPEVDQQDLS
jgi:hypothetical protein